MAPAENPFPVVGVGASAGGLSALNELVGAFPPNPGFATIVVQHLDPRMESMLTELLQAHTSLPVVDAVHGLKIQPDYIYVIQPNTSVALADGVLSVTARPEDRRPHYPVDHLFRSLATVQGSLAIGVVLSGTGSDGTLGICEIKAGGGVTFAQDEASAEFVGMPQNAVASGGIDLILPPAQIGARLASLAAQPYVHAELEPREAEPSDGGFQRVIAALRTTSGVDFSQYRDTTIKRRTARRMLLRGIQSPRGYAELLERDRSEADALYRDVLINVTSFFRDPEMFEDLKKQVLPEIVRSRPEGLPIRVWVPGCSTGQEAYSIAMVVLEFLDLAKIHRPIQIFATDLGDPAALDKARAGVYPESIESEVSAARLRRFFVKEEGGYRIQKNVRDLCVFARQNIAVDPPFSRVDLVTCRNVLIYMSPSLQDRLLPIFHFALNPGAFLVLGLAETVGAFNDLFEVVNRAHKIYRKKESLTRAPLTFMSDQWLTGPTPRRTISANHPLPDYLREADRVLLGRYAPPSVLVNQDFEIQQFKGRTAPYLESPSGQPTTSILRMAREGLFMELRSALSEAKASRSPVVREKLRVIHAGDNVEFTLRVLPVSSQGGDFALLVLFESENTPNWSSSDQSAEVSAESSDRELSWVKQELASSKQYLEVIVHQQESANQELRAAHEEVLSSNEELQSTNEELETTKEELQSSNEELTTLNEQSQGRNRDLDALTDDLSNFITSADLPMVTVGRDLRIRRLTPAAQRAFNLLPGDVGRSIEHIKFALNVEDIAKIVDEVVSTVSPWTREVTDREGRWWVLRVLPFRTSDSRVDGATLVAVDIDLIKRSHEVIEARDYALAIVQTVREPLVVLDGDCRVGLANETFYNLFGEDSRQMEGLLLWETGHAPWTDGSLRQAILSACEGRAPMTDREMEVVLPHLGRRVLILNARSIVRAGRPTLLLISIADVTDTRQAEKLKIDAETLRLLDQRKDEFLGILAHELRNPLAPMRFALEIMRKAEGQKDAISKAREVLERQVIHMVRIVDDLLDVSRITQGKVELRTETLDLATVVSAAVELCSPLVDAAGHALTVSLPDERVRIEADPVRMAQILVNLLNNAIKFTPVGGHIWLIADKMGEDPSHPNLLRIRVRDSGIGIAADVLPKIFDMFMQGDRSLEKTRGGLGVGLTLVRNLVALHGGSIEVRSDGVGSGSEFIVTFPLDPALQPEMVVPRSLSSKAPVARKIMVADDNADGREMLAFLLRSEGHTVATAGDGPELIAKLATFHADVAIVDIGMPGLNGYEAAARIRGEAARKDLILIALSGHSREEDREKAIESGFNLYFIKPVDVAALTRLLATTVVNPEAPESP